MRNIVLSAVFFSLTPLVLALSLFSLFVISDEVGEPQNTSVYGVRVYASLPSEFPTIGGEVLAYDARPEIVRQYLERWNSPMVSEAEFIVETADKYGLDYRLTTAIAQQESNVCKIIPPGGFNCWGWGIHSEGTLGFSSFREGIETVSKGLKENYLDLGLVTPEQIMAKYTPLSNGSWAAGVTTFMGDMQ